MVSAFDTSAPPPTHHPPDAFLVDHASGSLSDAESLMIGLHLDACAQCRETVRALSAIGGALLEAIEPAPLPLSLFEQTMRAIDDGERAPAAMRTPSPLLDNGWPASLSTRLAGRPAGKWRRFPAGFRALRIPNSDESNRLWIMKAPGGRGPLRHGHTKDEWTVVLEGGFTDETGTYGAGDFAYMDKGEAHTMIAEAGEGCLCVIMVRAYPVYMSLLGKLFAPLLRL